MGSSGTGNFSDYSNQKPQNGNEKTGGSSGENKCEKAFSTALEDVGSCTYYLTNNDVPPVDTDIELYFNKRIIARTIDKIDIGYVPTKFNYLKNCMDSGFSYTGKVTASSNSPIQSVIIDIIPT